MRDSHNQLHKQLHKQFVAAVRLCVGPEAIKKRLSEAWMNQLDSIAASELPEALQKEFRSLRSAMYAAKPLPNEPVPAASIRKMSSQQAALHTATILKLTGELQRICVHAEAGESADNQTLSFNGHVPVPDRLN